MEFFAKYIVVLIFFIIKGSALPKHLLPETPPEVQQKAVQDLIKRTVGENDSRRFEALLDSSLPFRSYKLSKATDDIVSIIGSDGVSVAKGFHHYLKYYLQKDVTWTNTRVELSSNRLPNVTETSTSASAFIYYQNVCTWSYSFAWWDWSAWQVHIDWMALMGISLTIAPIQEQLWHEIYFKMGLTEDEIGEHFAGPAFQAWQRMGNIRGWGGPLPSTYLRMQMLLQQKILKAQRELGISVALPAFAGHVPAAMSRLYPNVNFTAVERWNHFPNKYCCGLFLDPNEAIFREISKNFLQSAIEAYGTNHIYFADPFNEIQPRQSDSTYLNMTAYHIYESIHAVDESAIWLLQGWMFVKNMFWSDDLIKAFLTAVPRGKMLVLDLQSEQFPQYNRTHSFHGQPFIWCMLHNFGGTLGMHGSVDVINTQIRHARNMVNSSMIGVGITPEGINQNYAIYALALERAWKQEDFDLREWFSQYAIVRYGNDDVRLQAAWLLLQKSVYSYYGLKKMRGKYTITRRPSLDLQPWTWYNTSSIHNAWLLLLAANTSIPQNTLHTYEHDLVDITRQFLQAMADRLYVNLISSYKKRQTSRFNYIANKLMVLFGDLENILATNEDFLIGRWLESAKHMAQNPVERRLFEINARNQITAWGPNGQILDYATKQWSGVVRDYYSLRWALFLNMMQKSLKDNTKFNSTAFKEIVSNEIENPFSVQMVVYPTTVTGNTFLVSHRIFTNWTSLLKSQIFSHNLRVHVRMV